MNLKPTFDFSVADLIDRPPSPSVPADGVEDDRPKECREQVHRSVLPSPGVVDEPIHQFVAKFREKHAIKGDKGCSASPEKKLNAHVNGESGVDMRKRVGTEIFGDRSRNHAIPFKSVPGMMLSQSR